MPFTYRITVTVTSNSALLPSTQTNYPLWIDITDNVLKTTGNGGAVTSVDGYDVVAFSDSGLTSQLDFEWENLDAAYSGTSTGRLYGWVKIPSLAIGTVFYIGVGNAAITTQQGTPANTWDSNFELVMHMSDPFGGVGDGADSTANGNHGVVTGATDSNAGQLNEAHDFDGSTAQIQVTDDATLQLGTGDLTISAWVNSSNVAKGVTMQNTIVSKNFTGVELFIYETNLAGYIGGTSDICIGDDVLSNSTWYHVAIVRSGSSVKTLINGVVDGTATNSASASNAGTDVYVGHRPGGSSDEKFVGMIDEVRISSSARSDEWTLIDYNSQDDPATFSSFSVAAVSTATPRLRGVTQSNLSWR